MNAKLIEKQALFKKHYWWILLLSGAYAVILGIYGQESFLPFLIPFIILGAYAILAFPIFMFHLIVLITPLSLILETEFGAAIALPTEPMVALMMVLFIFKFLQEPITPKRALLHPISIVLILHLIWLVITTISSQDLLVSAKWTLVRFWYVIVFFFMGLIVFKKREHMKRFIWFYTITFSLLVFYFVYLHQQQYFTREAAKYVMQPFYKDHTIYGATLGLFLPLAFGFFLKGKDLQLSFTSYVWSAIFTFILAAGTVFSYTRATWVSLAVALGALVLFQFKIKLRSILATFGLFVILFFSFQDSILLYLEENKATSDNDLQTHLQSIYNVTTDESNTERLNRWSAAIRMFNEEPVFGFGPGVYMFEYGPYQVSHEKTGISTNFGDKGNAHSEYLGPLADTGLPGMLLVVALLLLSMHTGMKLYYKSQDPFVRSLAVIITLSLLTYYVHGVLNNFLDSDKVAIPFFGMTAILVALDVYFYRNEIKVPEKAQPNSINDE